MAPRPLLTAALLLGLAGCSTPCDEGTLLLEIVPGGAASDGDRVFVRVSVEDGGTGEQAFPLEGVGTIAVRFASGYPVGQRIIIDGVIERGWRTLAWAHEEIEAAPTCTRFVVDRWQAVTDAGGLDLRRAVDARPGDGPADLREEDAPPADLAAADAPLDLSPVDQAVGDLAAPADLAVADLAGADLKTVDLAVADLRRPADLVARDLARPDLVTRDLATPDLAAPDLATPDLATPDLVTVFDLNRDFSGSPWESIPSGTSANLRSIWGPQAEDIWAVGDRGTILRWNNAKWIPYRSPSANDLRSVWGSDGSNVWAVGQGGEIDYFDGSSWRQARTGGDGLNAVWAFNWDNVWAVGELGTVLRWDGKTWGRVNVSAAGGADLTGVWGPDPWEVWVVGTAATVLRWSGSTNRWTSYGAPVAGDCVGLWGDPGVDVWVAQALHVGRRVGTTWSDRTPTTGNLITSIWGRSASDAWLAMEGGSVSHWNGTSWTESLVSSTFRLNRVWIDFGGAVWVVGDNGTILRRR